jgi:hypothetical protein
VITLALLLIIALAALAGVVFLLGFRLGGEHWQSELVRVRMEGAHAQRQMHDLTRQAFITMAQHVERRRHRP